MTARDWRKCRVCGDIGDIGDMLRTGVRHYVHPGCYVEAGKPLSALTPSDIGRLPYAALAKAGLIEEARRLTKQA